jgi:hypothetical protein
MRITDRLGRSLRFPNEGVDGMSVYGQSAQLRAPNIGQNEDGNIQCGTDQLVVEAIGSQLAYFENISPPCRGLELPDGLLLRSTRSDSLYFYFRTGADNGKIKTDVFASDSPYDRQKAGIGSVVTPMFEPGADYNHLMQLEKLIRGWVDFVQEEPDSTRDFQSFLVGP